ncbi:MAG: Holliday junction DNA helicase RuvA [Parasphingorhabdus sp.]|jgi:Holliday junction DNA helicase RuvA
MIGFLEGRLVQKQPPQLLVNVSGVGYEVEAPMTTFYDLPDTGANVLLHIHMQVREDAHRLYGFSTRAQRDLFRMLLKVNGVGPRVALAILSGLRVEEFHQCVMQGDITALTRVPGIGRKTAERLLIEMRDKLEDISNTSIESSMSSTGIATDPVSEAVSALIALGYKPTEASRVVQSINHEDATSESLIRQALSSLSGSKL